MGNRKRKSGLKKIRLPQWLFHPKIVIFLTRAGFAVCRMERKRSKNSLKKLALHEKSSVW